MPFGAFNATYGGFFKPQGGPPNWNANTGAYKDLYPEQKELGPGEWGFKNPDEVAQLNKEWFAEQKKKAPQQLSGFGLGDNNWRSPNGWGNRYSGAGTDLGLRIF